MKSKISNSLLVLLWMFSLPVSEALPRDTDEKFYNYPVLLDGRPVDFTVFSSISKGKISLVKRKPECGAQVKTTFYVYLRRAGKIIDADSYMHNFAVKEFEMADILKSARAGDEIVIDPASISEKSGRRTIIVKQIQLMLPFQWFPLFNKSKEGC